jgi:hypothetical protein
MNDRTIIRTAILTMVIAATAAAPAAARQVDLISDRPDFTESAAAMRAGMIQVEGGYLLSSDGEEMGHSLGEVLARIGLGGPVELRLGLNSYRIEAGDDVTHRGIEDGSLGAKIALAGGAGWIPASALLATMTLPTGASAIGGGAREVEVVGAFSWELPAGWGFASNVGWGSGELGEREAHGWSASVTAGHAIGERLDAFAEMYGLRSAGDNRLFSEVGVTFAVSEDLQLDVHGGSQLSGTGSERSIGVGIVRRWGTGR